MLHGGNASGDAIIVKNITQKEMIE